MEPAHQLPDEDRPAIEPDIRPHLEALEGGGETSERKSGHLRSVDNQDEWKKHQGGRGDISDDKSANSKEGMAAAALAKAEAAWGEAGLYNNKDNGASFRDRIRQRFNFQITRKQAIGGGLVGLLLGGGFMGLTIMSGPLQAVMLMQVLSQNNNQQEDTSKIRIGSLLRYARTGNVGETRVGLVGSKLFASTVKQLQDIGIEFELNSYTGRPDAVKINTEKLSEKYPEVKNMSPDEVQGFLQGNFGSKSLGSFTEVSKGVYSADASSLGISETRLLTKNFARNLDDGKILTAIRYRNLDKYFDVPSLFHPFRRAQSSINKKLSAKAQAAAEKADEQKRAEAQQPKPSEDVVAAESDMKSKLSGAKAKLSGALLFTAGMCLVRSVADDAIKVNHGIKDASAALAIDAIATGSQVQNGDDITMQQLGTSTTAHTDENGNSIWTGRALKATEDPANPAGTDLTPDYRQAFYKDTTANNIKSTVGGAGIGAIVCSPAGTFVQLVAGAGIIISGFVDGFTSWTALAIKAGTTGGGMLATGGFTYFLQKQLDNILVNKALVPAIAKGALGGNLLAFGAREAANITARASGGIAIAGSATQILAYNNSDFTSKPLYAQVFDAKDYRSLVGKIVISQNPDPAQNFKHMASTFLNPGSLFSGLFSLINPRAHAATQPYDWGFEQYGIPKSIATDPAFADPYANGDAVAKLLDAEQNGSGTSYGDKIEKCFGDKATKDANGDWGVTPDKEVNPNDSDYIDANCSDTSDPNWKRVMLFVFDTQTVEAANCYNGDDQSCTNVGYGSGSSSASSAGGTGTYQNPLRDVKNIGGSRIDEGVDYTGDGPVYALGNGTVDYANTHDAWPGGNYISYTLSDGPAAGKSVYVAENCTGTTLAKGDKVTSSTVLCTMHNAYPFIETGWSQGGNDLPMSHDVYSEGAQTAYGINFDKLMQSLGAPAASPPASGSGVGNLASGWPSW